MFTSIESEYAAAQTGCVVYNASARGRLKLTGKTRLDLLHRMSTNDLNSLTVGQGAATVFTTPIARIIDRTIVYVRADDLIMVTSRGNQAHMLGWLRKHIFFNDDVQVVDQTETSGMLSLYGKTADQLLAQITGQNLSALPLYHWREGRAGDTDVLVARADPIAAGGFHLIADASTLAQVRQAALEAGATPIGEQAYQVLRVEAGQPEFGHELTDEYIPLEAGLWPDVSFTKGCYTGQEIIARMESRHQLARQLVGLLFEAEVAPGSTLRLEGSEVGRVTSVARSPDRGWIGLGYLKPGQVSEGQLVQCSGEAASATARVAPLPVIKSA